MKITIECTPSDLADALLHLLDGGEVGTDPAAHPWDDGGALPDETSERLKRMIQCYDKPWHCLAAERNLAAKGGDA